MNRNRSKDTRIFKLQLELDQITKLYPAHQTEVREFLNYKNGPSELDGKNRTEVYQLIEENLGFPIPN